ncbi:AAA family ATPase [Pyramidobacter sp. SM-530-WT-4B]|uniref:AAA family ATPase n=1 Tax=Pyramidobacter porci TaxID=2605789 RepID=A0A6L5YAC0_9BACT|nr:AAA family ATPase [Pyramidobacter porci]MST55244.1 AAA family ATPase [Pyramidobacter porci]
MCSPLREDHNPSFSVNLEKGCWNDFATGESGTLTELADRLGVPAPEYAGGETSSSRKEQDTKAAAAERKKVEAARAVWEMATEDEVPAHEYLKAKQVDATGLNLRRLSLSGPALPEPYQKIPRRGQLVVPVYDAKTGQLVGVELIDCFKTDGKWGKRDLGVKEAGYWEAGTCSGKDAPIVFCEGMATAATVKRFVSDSARVICCFGAGNVPVVAAAFHARFPGREIVIAADAGEAGENAYNEVRLGEAKKCGRGHENDVLRPAIPDALKAIPKGENNADWNDVVLAKGFEAARTEFEKRLKLSRMLRDMQASACSTPKVKFFTTSELMAMRFEDERWAVEGLVPSGLTVLASIAKKGKSWLCLQMGAAVAAGKPFLGMKTTQGAVLYAALEDTQARLKERLQLLYPMGGVPSVMSFTTTFPRLDAGGLKQLLEWVVENSPSLVVIDVWNKVKPAGTDKSLNAYEADYKAVGPLKALADATDTPILLVHHLKKGSAASGEMLEGLSGSMGLPSAADAILTLKREGQNETAIIERTGRDLDCTDDIPIRWTKPAGWRLFTPEEIYKERREKENGTARAIFDALKESGAPMSPKQIAEAAGISQQNVRMYVKRLKDAGQLHRFSNGRYYLAKEAVPCHEEKEDPPINNNPSLFSVTPVTGVTPVTPVTPVTVGQERGCYASVTPVVTPIRSSDTNGLGEKRNSVTGVTDTPGCLSKYEETGEIRDDSPDEGFSLRGNASYECPEGYIPANQEVTI